MKEMVEQCSRPRGMVGRCVLGGGGSIGLLIRNQSRIPSNKIICKLNVDGCDDDDDSYDSNDFRMTSLFLLQSDANKCSQCSICRQVPQMLLFSLFVRHFQPHLNTSLSETIPSSAICNFLFENIQILTKSLQ